VSVVDLKSKPKDLYAVGEMPPMGHVPAQMHAWAIRRERHGDPDKSMLLEVVDVPQIDSLEVLVLVMAAGVNYTVSGPGLASRSARLTFTKLIFTSPGRTRQASSGLWATRSPAGRLATRW